MKKGFTKIISLLCTLVMVLSLVPASVFADESSAELTGKGTAKVIFQDDFESYAVGKDSFYNDTGTSYTKTRKDESAGADIEQDGKNKYLVLNAGNKSNVKSVVNTTITGDYTVQFDFCYESAASSQIVYCALWEGSKLAETSQLLPSSVRFQHKQYYTGETSDLKDVSNNIKRDAATGKWQTVKIARTNGAVYVKIWDKGTTEPSTWEFKNEHQIYDTSLTSKFRISFYSGNEGNNRFLMDNLKITQQSESAVDPGAAADAKLPTAPKSTKSNAKKVLFIGDEGAQDLAAYLPQLGQLTGVEYSVGCLSVENGTLRNHAENTTNYFANYDYTKGNDSTKYKMQRVGKADEKVTLTYAVNEEKWDVIVLKQGTGVDGIYGTYDEDLNFLLDLIADKQPQAKVYWNMNWAPDDDYATSAAYERFPAKSNQFMKAEIFYESYYYNNPSIHYNAIVDNMNDYILTNKNFDGIIYTGIAMENVRNSALGRTVTRDGYALSYKEGRLAAGLTVLKALEPSADLNKITASQLESILEGTDTYTNNDANLAVLRQAATDALAGKMTKRTFENVQPVNNAEGVINVDTGLAPHYMRFPDVAAMDDGTLYVSSCDATAHGPTMQGGSGVYDLEGEMRTFFYKSTDNGQTWQKTGFVLTPTQLEKWGICQYHNRYARWKENPSTDYLLFTHPCDANIVSAHVDVNGDGKKENILILTFWSYELYESGKYNTGRATYLTYSLDGMNWATPVTISGGLKRGDITEFNDGTILVPLYSKVATVRMEFKDGKFREMYRTDLPNTSPNESTNFNEISVISPRGDSTVYCFVRESGAMLRSDDYGKTWREVGNEDGLIHQPGLCKLDDGRVFATWADTASPRFVYGRTFYPDADYTDTTTNLIYDSALTTHDMGDPSCATMANGKVFVVFYDTYYRATYGRIIDPNSTEYLPTELTDTENAVTIKEGNFDASGSVSADIADSYTAAFDFTLTDASSSVSVRTQAGTVTINATTLDIAGTKTALSLATGTKTNARIARIGAALYAKVWQGTEPDNWTYGLGTNGTDTPAITGTNAAMGAYRFSKNITVNFPAAATATIGDTITVSITPKQSQAQLTSSDPSVVKVDGTSYTALKAGTATLTLKICGVTKTCTVTVKSSTAELTASDNGTVLFSDNFEQYSVGTDTFWKEMGSYGYKSNVTEKSENCTLSIAKDGDNQYLRLGASNKAATWHKVDLPIAGDYTVQYDFKMENIGSQILYMTFWQDSDDVFERTEIIPSYARIEYNSGATTGLKAYGPCDTEVGKWHTFKATRTGGAIYVKIWTRGEAEPNGWTLVTKDTTFDSSEKTTFRFQYWSSLTTPAYIDIDNFVISQGGFANSLAQKLYDLELFKGVGTKTDGTVDFDLNREPTRAEALVMLVRMLGKENEALNGTWSHPFTDVPEWADKYVGYAYQNKLTNGVSDTLFGTDETTTGAMYVTFVLRAMGYSDAAGEFTWDKPQSLAAQCGFMSTNDRMKTFLRGDAVTVSAKALDCAMKDGKILSDKLIGDGVFTAEQYKKVMQ